MRKAERGEKGLSVPRWHKTLQQIKNRRKKIFSLTGYTAR